MVQHQSGFQYPLEMTRIVLKPEDVERIRTGRVCIHCQEPLEEAFPVKCPVCKYPVRKLQAQHFAERYLGAETPPMSMDEHFARFDEEDARKAHQPGSQIILPRGVDS